MMWIWLSVAVILIGSKLDAEIEHQVSRGSNSKLLKLSDDNRDSGG